jgi:sugar phosphate isomerase/epimerase
MERREFLKQTAAKGIGMMSLPFMKMPQTLQGKKMGVVVHSYASRWQSKINSSLYPSFINAIELLNHCHSIGAGGIQVMVRDWSQDFAKKVRDKRENLGLFIEGSIAVPTTSSDVSRFETEVINAKEAGAVILRTVTSTGRRYEVYHSEADVKSFKEQAMTSLRLAEPVLRKHKAKLAVENHKDWRAVELAAAIKELQSEWIGVTLDFGNSISLIEEPMEVIETLAPFAFSTHVKDMGLEEYDEGFLLSEVPLGKGMLDIPRIMALCEKYNPAVNFSLEMITRDPLEIPCLKNEFWNVFPEVPGKDLARTLRMVKENKYEGPLPRVSQLTPEERLAEEEKNVIECLTFAKKIKS